MCPRGEGSLQRAEKSSLLSPEPNPKMKSGETDSKKAGDHTPTGTQDTSPISSFLTDAF